MAPFALTRSILEISPFFAAYVIAVLLFRVFGSRLGNRLGLRLSIAGAMLCYGAVVLAVGMFGPEALVSLGLGFGAAHGVVFPSLMALLLRDAPDSARPAIAVASNGAMNVGVLSVGPVGVAAGYLGYARRFIVIGLVDGREHHSAFALAAHALTFHPPARARAAREMLPIAALRDAPEIGGLP